MMNGLLRSALAPDALHGKSALVFGASSGIGLASAKVLASLGVEPILLARNTAKLRKAAERLAQTSGQRVGTEAVDITDADALEQVLARYRDVDILVTNCGGPPVQPFEQIGLDDWEQAWRAQLRSVVQACRVLVPEMAGRGWGRVIMIASITVVHPLRGFALSNSIRPGLAGLAATLSQEYAAQGITANLVCPGITRTERMEKLLAQAAAKGRSRDAVLQEWTGKIPVGRMGEPDEIAAMVGFLASDAAAFITGQSLVVDGGESRNGG